MGRAATCLTIARQAIVEAAGMPAAETLRKGGRGSVVAAFEHSVYLAFEETGDALVSLGCADFPKGPLNISTTLATFAGIAPGMSAYVDGASIFLGDQAALHVGRAGMTIWRPQPARPWMPAAVAGGIAALRRLQNGRAKAFAAAMSGSAALDVLLRRRAAAGADALRAWLSGETPMDAVARDGVEALLGLGPGLTPSGDDFLVGALIALVELRDQPRFAALAGIIGAMAPGRTGRISAAHLVMATEGMAADPLHRTVRAILGGGGELDAALAALDGVGYSSGHDALAGALVALEAVGLNHNSHLLGVSSTS